VGRGDIQVRADIHESRFIEFKEHFESNEDSLTEDMKQFFKLFQESTEEGSKDAALEMTKIANRMTKQVQKWLLFHSLYFLARSDSKKLRWSNSPLLVLLQLVDPNVMSGNENAPLQEDQARETPLHHLASLAAPSDYSTHKNQLILAKQLIEHGANVNAVSSPEGRTPLHDSCHGAVVGRFVPGRFG
jgi:hypothetical protein